MHLKCLEIERFKSFGPYTRIPLMEGFTVVSGPNGSGKSNIIDALLFALGLSTSRGMRAEKLSDLLHQGVQKGEAAVTVTFDLGDTQEIPGGELTVCRRLKVNGPNSTSSYHLNGNPCTLGELHDELSRHRIYPEGYNVVLQGDVTGIITMPARERREIIDELAGVAEFDRKIEAARRELGDVEHRSDRIQVVVTELREQMERLQKERAKAEEYRELRSELQKLALWEQVLNALQARAQLEQLGLEIAESQKRLAALAVEDETLTCDLEQAEDALDTANTRVKLMGENEQVALRTQLATLAAERTQIERALDNIRQQRGQAERRGEQLEAELGDLALQLTHYLEQQQEQAHLVTQWTARLERDRQSLESARGELEQLSASSQRWVEEQTALRRTLEAMLAEHDPLQRRFDRLGDRLQQRSGESNRQKNERVQLEASRETLERELIAADTQLHSAREHLEQNRTALEAGRAQALSDLTTQRRLEKERTEKSRELDRIETQRQVWREAEGSRATQEVLGSRLQGVCGLISQLGRVEPAYQMALEVAAGGRLNNIVVEDDAVAAEAIELLKQRRAGRATFLPLNKLKPRYRLEPLREEGAMGYALDLIEYDHHYEPAFAQVFGDTVVFRSLELARRQLGRYRIVTLAGELLEKSGAMTGGSQDARSRGGFAASEPPELAAIRKRIAEIDMVLSGLTDRIEERERRTAELQKTVDVAQRTLVMSENRAEQLRRELSQQQHRHVQLCLAIDSEVTSEEADRAEHAQLEERLRPLQTSLAELRAQLQQLEHSDAHHQWQESQQHLRELETEVRRTEVQLRHSEADLQKSRLDEQLGQEKRQNLYARRLELDAQKVELAEREEADRARLQSLDAAILKLQGQIAEVETRLGDSKRERDLLEKQVRTLQNRKRQLELAHEQERMHQGRREQAYLQATERLGELADVPDAPDLPPDLTLEQLQPLRARKQRRLESLEPVNMLAIEEFERTEARMRELSEKLATLQHERSELLLRIEDCDTLKRSAFMQAFDAVNAHFQSLFAELSDGDGHLTLEDPENPFAAGLTLVAHPRGKQVRRLESMSGGEKSLTALSFIFALQRYRPSPFYAFDEVDMFLDGSNVERLARMIRQQADSTQFLVVSLRRPMIERADRAIGVTLARGGHSQVLGVKLAADAAS